MKKETQISHSQLANFMMYYIYEYIDSDININEVSRDFGVSQFHFHRVFKEQFGTNIYETIKATRLQRASNLLISNKHSNIVDIAKICGYSSATSFTRAFKARFGQSPKYWKNGGYKEYSKEILSGFETVKKDYSHLAPKIVKTSPKRVYYIRVKRYSKHISSVWQKLMAWVYTHNLHDFNQMGIYHDNPVITPPDECNYVAAIALKENEIIQDTGLPSFVTPADVCACFSIEGESEEILSFVQWVYHEWLPNSGYETTAAPSYTIIEKNHYLSDDGHFKAQYYIPIRYNNL